MIKLKCVKALGGGLTVGKEYLVENLHFKDDEGMQRCHSKTMLPNCFEIVMEAAVKEVVEQLATEVKPKKTKKWSRWFKHTTDKQPIDDDILVKVKFSDGTKGKNLAGEWGWFKPDEDGDGAIRYYKIKLV